MEEEKCKECGKIIKRKTKQLVKRELKKHIENEHNMSYKDYILKHNYGGVHPTCACGCGRKTNYHKGIFFKYFSNHKNHVVGVYKNPKKEKSKNEKINLIESKLKTVNLTISDLKKYYDDFLNFNYSLNDLEKEICMDKRTFKKYWMELGFIKNNEDFIRLTRKHQAYWHKFSEKRKTKINDEKLYDLYFYLEKNKNKYTLKELKNKFEISDSVLVIYKRLCENFDEKTIKKMLRHGNSSNPEIEFYNVLNYFFKDELEKQYKLEGKYYDIKLSNNILIEFDGEYWHSMEKNIKNDKEKNKIAKENGFILIRVKDSESHNLEIIKKIIKIYEIQAEKNK
ncbi:MAG: hypothetical protein M0R46_17440 [Candidatus Muirbacterium halophilum]|nr:hypothetical protein [Candidatus Muirbacterium halophilum]